MPGKLTVESLDKLLFELDELEQINISIGNKKLKPSQCYRFVSDPPHILFNTNCPDRLRQKIESIISTYHVSE